MAKKKTTAFPKDLSFEEALARLEEIVRELEEADLPLEKSLAVFEEGVRLSRFLHEKLNEAERKVEILMANEEGGKTAVPFRGEGAPDPAAPPDEGGGDDDEEEEDDDEGTGGAGASGAGQTGFRF